MSGLSSSQIRDTRDKLLDTVETLTQLLRNKRDQLSKHEKQEINKAADELSNASDLLTAQAIHGTEQEIRHSVQRIMDATNTANIALKNITKIKAAIGITAALIGLAASIISGNPKGILRAANEVFKAVNTA